jgi:hypothetical protein
MLLEGDGCRLIWHIYIYIHVHTQCTSLWKCLSLMDLSTTYCCIEYTSPWIGFELTTLVVIGIDCIGSCKSNYRTIITTTAPVKRTSVSQWLATGRLFPPGILVSSTNKTDRHDVTEILLKAAIYVPSTHAYTYVGFKSRRGKNKKLTALKS